MHYLYGVNRDSLLMQSRVHECKYILIAFKCEINSKYWLYKPDFHVVF